MEVDSFYRRIAQRGIVAGLLLQCVSLAGAFNIQPGMTIVSVKPGTERQISYEVTNDREFPITVGCEIKDSYILPENGHMSARQWLKPLFTLLAVPSHSSIKANFQIVTSKTNSGELAATISFVPDESGDKNVITGGMVSIATRVTAALYVRLTGTEKKSAAVGTVQLQNQPAQGALPARIDASVEVLNQGNTHQRPDVGFYVFTKGSDKPRATIQIPNGWPVMPYTREVYKHFIQGQLGPGSYVVDVRVLFSKEWEIKKRVEFTVDASGRMGGYHEVS